MRVLFIAFAIVIIGAALCWLGGAVNAQTAPPAQLHFTSAQKNAIAVKAIQTAADARYAQIANAIESNRRAKR